ncbi:tellurium resistance protein TerC [Actinomyces trachealis]|uniref:tellurium resistance protein TerC n=1 Tax=Actinomyces trachealis TaxID=2763540 RepID=UPI001F3A08C5|nr:tellurium resistance protein TerC [Actinomyces trachealis]
MKQPTPPEPDAVEKLARRNATATSRAGSRPEARPVGRAASRTAGASRPVTGADHGTRRGAARAPEPGIVDPAWTRLAVAGLVPVLLAVTSALPGWVRSALVVVLVLLAAQGWSALTRTRHDLRSVALLAVTGVLAVVAVTVSGDFGMAGLVMALSVLAAFVAQMTRGDGREELVEDLSANVTGCLTVVLGAGWVALEEGLADPSVIVPCAVCLLLGALLTMLEVRALVLETLTVVVPTIAAGIMGGVLAVTGFFGPAHVAMTEAMQTAAACLVVGFTAGVLMAAANRILWTHRWVPGGRAAVASAVVPVLVTGAPAYAIARLMGSFIAG